MTTMTTALRAAGTPLPSTSFRIWHWLKDHPEKTNEDIQKALGLTYTIHNFTIKMERDGLIKAYSDVSRKSGIKGVQYKIKRFSVVNKDEFEKPLRKVYKKKVKPVLTAVKPAPALVTPVAEFKFNPENFIAAISLTNTKALYVYLHGVFE